MTDTSINLAPQFDDVVQQRAAATLGIWIFLATEILFFGVLFAVYAIFRTQYPDAFAAGSRLTDITLASINTAVLLTSSLTMSLAVHAASNDMQPALLRWLMASILLGVLFLCIKGVEYYVDYEEHLVPTVNFVYQGAQSSQVELFFYLYFFITAVHGLHVLIGVGAMTWMVSLARQRRFSSAYYTPVDVTALYWHLVDIIWLFVYPCLYLVART